MKKSTLEKIEEEVEKRTKLSKEEKKEIRKKIFLNIIIALMIIIYFVGIILLSINSSQNMKELYLKISSIVAVIMSIIIFEVAYKKDSGKIAIFGIEVLIMSIANLFLPYLLYKLKIEYIKIIIISISAFCVYYIIKLLTIYIHNKRKFLKNNSDIKNIIKKESSYPEKVEIMEPEIKPKKRGRPKKTVQEKLDKKETVIDEKKSNKVENKQNQNISPKKRGRPKKVVQEDNKIEKKDNAPAKKRGRPKKEKVENK